MSEQKTGSTVIVAATSVDKDTLPGLFNGDFTWVADGSICTDSPLQYVVWVDEHRHAQLARRTLGEPWQKPIDLSKVAATRLGEFVEDSHNYVTVAVDEAGYVHVAGNMHAHPLKAGDPNPERGPIPIRYMRTEEPGSLDKWLSGMDATGRKPGEEEYVTYPRFIRGTTGDLYLHYRHGFSSNGNDLLNKWDHRNKTWSRVCEIFQGWNGSSIRAEDVSAYPQRIAVDPKSGRWHLLWTVREDFRSVVSNTGIYYAYSDDEGATWKRNDGSLYELPITQDTGDRIFDNDYGKTNQRIIASGGACAVDSKGDLHSAWLISDPGSNELKYHYYAHINGEWMNEPEAVLPDIEGGGRPPGLVCFADGPTWMLYQNEAAPRHGRLYRYDVDHKTDEPVSPALNDDLVIYTPVVDMSTHGTSVYVLFARTKNGTDENHTQDLSAQTDATVLTIHPSTA